MCEAMARPPFDTYRSALSFWGAALPRQRAGGEPVRARRGGGACSTGCAPTRCCFRCDEDDTAHRAGHRRPPRAPITPALSARSTSSGISPPSCGSGWTVAKPRTSRPSVPARIERIEISSRTRPEVYTFGTAEIGPLAGEHRDCPTTSAPAARQHPGLAQTPPARRIDRWRETGHAWRRSRDRASPRGTATPRSMRASPSRPGPSSVSVSWSHRVRPACARAHRRDRRPAAGRDLSPEVLDRVAERLRDTGVFSAVALGEQPLGPGDTMDIVATLTESPPRRFGFGAELSTDSGARVSAFWLHRNLFGGAERLRIEGEVRGIGAGGAVGRRDRRHRRGNARAHFATGHLHARYAGLWRDRHRRPR
jgi:hypothetical protein